MYQPPAQGAVAEWMTARWPSGVSCPFCRACGCNYVLGSGTEGTCVTQALRLRWKCGDCRRVFSLTTATFLHATKVSLAEWLRTISLVCEHPQGVDSLELSRFLGITRKSALAMLRRLARASGNRFARRQRHLAAKEWWKVHASEATDEQRRQIRQILRRAGGESAQPTPVHRVAPVGRSPNSFRLSLWPLSPGEAMQVLMQTRFE